ncbi:hypothetical protein F4805DRAFT_419562 [Annulohypoxylon moriforme]|nr:hypothetical protein F4805DRAFT_419562 [Annulohypoxylon moriforme]
MDGIDLSASGNYSARLESFHRLDKERDEMLKELITKYQDLEQRFQSKCKEHDNEAQTRSLYQSQANEANKRLIDIQHRTEVNSFVIAIIDGDGACFHKDWIEKGAEGGSIAAQQLRLNIKQHLKDIYPDVNVDLWNIMIQISLNLDGLSKKLEKIKFVQTLNVLPDFTRGFSRAHGLYSIIDVGWGKEQADFKVRETLRLLVHNLQCKHIIFGPCHDKGYIAELRPYQFDTSISPKLSLLETTIPPRDFQELRFRRVRFSDVFRSEPLPDGPPPPSPPIMLSPTTPLTPPPPTNHSNIAFSSTPGVASMIPSSWDTGTPPPTIKESRKFTSTPDNSMRSSAPPPKYYLINFAGQRVDEEIPFNDPEAEYRLQMRAAKEDKIVKKRGPCNRWHVNGRCDITNCPYYHGERLGYDEQLVLRRKARSMLCTRRSACRDADCLWGHHCKYGGKKCLRRDCNFVDMHDVDATPAEKVYEDGSHERLSKRPSF